MGGSSSADGVGSGEADAAVVDGSFVDVVFFFKPEGSSASTFLLLRDDILVLLCEVVD